MPDSTRAATTGAGVNWFQLLEQILVATGVDVDGAGGCVEPGSPIHGGASQQRHDAVAGQHQALWSLLRRSWIAC